MKRKFLFLALFLTAGFFTSNRAEECTLNAEGTCKCVGVYDSGVLVGYRCVTMESGETTNYKCVCPPPPEG